MASSEISDTRYFFDEEQLFLLEQIIKENELRTYNVINKRDYVLNKNLKNLCWHYYLIALNIENMLSIDKIFNVYMDPSYSDINNYFKSIFFNKSHIVCYYSDYTKYRKYKVNFVQTLLSGLILEGHNLHTNISFSEDVLNLCHILKEYASAPNWLRNKYDYIYKLMWDYHYGDNKEKYDSMQFIKCLKCRSKYVNTLGLKKDSRKYEDSISFYKDVFMCYSPKDIRGYITDKRKLIIIFNNVDMKKLISDHYLLYEFLSNIKNNNILSRDVSMILISNQNINLKYYDNILYLNNLNGMYENEVASYKVIPNVKDKTHLSNIINNVLQELIQYNYSIKEKLLRSKKHGLVDILIDIIKNNCENVTVSILYSYINTFMGYLLENELNSFNKEGLKDLFSQ